MLLSRSKHVASVSQTTAGNRRPAKTTELCPKSGKSAERNRNHRWLIWMFPIGGLLSLLWFLVRVVPKPSRASYPCQRVAFPLASCFVVWLLGLVGSAAMFRKAKWSPNA